VNNLWFVLLVILLCVLIVSCTTDPLPTEPITTPTNYPPVTLTLRQVATSTPLIITNPPTTTSIPPTLPTTPTATPQTHVIGNGDTLLGIALQYGVPLEALQSTNPDVDARALQIGQVITIPPLDGNTPTNNTISPTPIPLNLSILPPTCYPQPRDNMALCLGVVQNTLGVAVERIEIEFDLGTKRISSPIEQRLIMAGSFAPYRVLIPYPTTTPLATLLSADEAPNISQRYAALSVQNVRLDFVDGRSVVFATISNIDSVNTQDLRYTAIVQAQDGRVLGYRVVVDGTSLTAGHTMEVQVAVTLQQVESAPVVSLIADARRAAP
jgi:LysM repeat protein